MKRAHDRWSLLTKRSRDMMRVGADYASWSAGQKRHAWNSGYDYVERFTAKAPRTASLMYKHPVSIVGPPTAETIFDYEDGEPRRFFRSG